MSKVNSAPHHAIDFLLKGDPAIRWQAQRDLLDASESTWMLEKDRVLSEGWGASFMASQDESGGWPTGRWSGTIWTLLVLIDLGMPSDDLRLNGAFNSVASRLMPLERPISPELLLSQMDLCHLGFWLRIGAYFTPEDPRLPHLFDVIIGTQMADGGWNCRIRTNPSTVHGSFHTGKH